MICAILKDDRCINAVKVGEDIVVSSHMPSIPDGYWIGDYYKDGNWYHERPLTGFQILGQQLTDMQLASIAQGQRQTALELAAIEQGQKITDVELEVLKNV